MKRLFPISLVLVFMVAGCSSTPKPKPKVSAQKVDSSGYPCGKEWTYKDSLKRGKNGQLYLSAAGKQTIIPKRARLTTAAADSDAHKNIARIFKMRVDSMFKGYDDIIDSNEVSDSAQKLQLGIKDVVSESLSSVIIADRCKDNGIMYSRAVLLMEKFKTAASSNNNLSPEIKSEIMKNSDAFFAEMQEQMDIVE